MKNFSLKHFKSLATLRQMRPENAAAYIDQHAVNCISFLKWTKEHGPETKPSGYPFLYRGLRHLMRCAAELRLPITTYADGLAALGPDSGLSASDAPIELESGYVVPLSECSPSNLAQAASHANRKAERLEAQAARIRMVGAVIEGGAACRTV